MSFVVVHVNHPKAHLCSVHMKLCPEIEAKRKLAGYFVKVFSDPRHGLGDAWNYINDNGWDSEPDFCDCFRP